MLRRRQPGLCQEGWNSLSEVRRQGGEELPYEVPGHLGQAGPSPARLPPHVFF